MLRSGWAAGSMLATIQVNGRIYKLGTILHDRLKLVLSMSLSRMRMQDKQESRGMGLGLFKLRKRAGLARESEFDY